MFASIVALAALVSVRACVELIGHAHKATDNATEWDYGFLGDDWVGTDAKGAPWTCMHGHYQSPINLPRAAPQLPYGVKTQFFVNPEVPMDRPTADVWNNGHTIQVQNFSNTLVGLSIPTLKGTITDMVAHKIDNVADLKWVYVPAIQFHFHTASEHQFEGMHANLELHVVHKAAPDAFRGCGPLGCLAVVGMHVRVGGDKDNDALAPIFHAMPFQEMSKTVLPPGTPLDFNRIYPKKRTYVTYKGSLTTPPCTEGVLWMVMTEPIYISRRQYKMYRNAVGAKHCESAENEPPANCSLAAWDENYRMTQPRLGRNIYMAL